MKKIISIALLLAMLLTLCACSSEPDPNEGMYTASTYEYAGFKLNAEGEWLELKSGGKLTIFLLGEEYSGRWTRDGENLTIKQGGYEYSGTVKDGVIVLDLDGLIYTYIKEA